MSKYSSVQLQPFLPTRYILSKHPGYQWIFIFYLLTDPKILQEEITSFLLLTSIFTNLQNLEF